MESVKVQKKNNNNNNNCITWIIKDVQITCKLRKYRREKRVKTALLFTMNATSTCNKCFLYMIIVIWNKLDSQCPQKRMQNISRVSFNFFFIIFYCKVTLLRKIDWVTSYYFFFKMYTIIDIIVSTCSRMLKYITDW